MFEINGKYTTAKIMIDEIEATCVSQIHGFVNHPAFTNPVAIMPDTHTGKGSVIGFTMEMTDKIIPNIVGVDLGCGMLAINIGKNIPISFKMLDDEIRKKVPFGMNTHNRSVINMERNFPWKDVNTSAHNFSLAYNKKFRTNIYFNEYDYNWFERKCTVIDGHINRIINSIGTLGGGNHFIEIGKDDNDDYWVVIHTGSRNFGKCICEYWQNIASNVVKKEKDEQFREEVEFIRKNYKGEDIKNMIMYAKARIGVSENVSDELMYLEGADAHGYLFDMIFAQKYAEVNRSYIASIIMKILNVPEIDRIETVHNFMDFRDFIIRKGAVRSYAGERFILPFNMRDGILICEGKSNPDWNCSAPHGAGRLMSRANAKKNIQMDTFKNQMNGIFSTSVNKDTLDEAPDAYKDASTIEKAIAPTAKILLRIKPVMNMKDSGKNFK